MTIKKLRVKRGLKKNLPALDVGELALTTDESKLYVGHADGNQGLVTDKELTLVNTEIGKVTTQLAQTATKEEIDQINLNLNQKDVNVNNRIDGLIVNQGQDSSAEVADARQDILGVSHPLVGNRINSDFNYIQGINNFTTVPIYVDGVVVRIEERNGDEIISSTVLKRNSDGDVIGTNKTVSGKTVIATYNKENGSLISITKEVV